MYTVGVCTRNVYSCRDKGRNMSKDEGKYLTSQTQTCLATQTFSVRPAAVLTPSQKKYVSPPHFGTMPPDHRTENPEAPPTGAEPVLMLRASTRSANGGPAKAVFCQYCAFNPLFAGAPLVALSAVMSAVAITAMAVYRDTKEDS